MFLYSCALIGCHVSVIFLIVQSSRYILWYYSITDLSALFWSHTLELYNLRIIQSAPAVISVMLLTVNQSPRSHSRDQLHYIVWETH